MSTPVDSLKFAHHAIIAEVARIDEVLSNAQNADDMAPMNEALADLSQMLDGHTAGEEKGVFPRLKKIESHMADTYLHDHVNEKKVMQNLRDAVKDGKVPMAGRLAAVFRAHVEEHIEKENELVIPFLKESFDVPEQAQIVQDVLSAFTPEETQKFMPWIVARLPDPVAEAYVNVLSKVLPPERFEMAKGWIKDGLTEDQWTNLLKIAPIMG
jgi:hemerythrin-like domain-containing protein